MSSQVASESQQPIFFQVERKRRRDTEERQGADSPGAVQLYQLTYLSTQ